jgi:hypothetical protein
MELGLTVTITDEGLAPFGQFHGKVVKLLEIVTGVGDLPRLEPKPSYHLQDGVKVNTFFGIRVGIVESVYAPSKSSPFVTCHSSSPKVTTSVVVLGVSEIDGDGFCVTDMEVTVGFGRESCHDPFSSSFQVFLHVFLVDLGVLTGSV